MFGSHLQILAVILPKARALGEAVWKASGERTLLASHFSTITWPVIDGWIEQW
jgi:hypothetical protein